MDFGVQICPAMCKTVARIKLLNNVSGTKEEEEVQGVLDVCMYISRLSTGFAGNTT